MEWIRFNSREYPEKLMYSSAIDILLMYENEFSVRIDSFSIHGTDLSTGAKFGSIANLGMFRSTPL